MPGRLPRHPLALLSGRYRLAARPLEVRTSDGLRLSGHRVGDAETAVVLCHGFSGWHAKPSQLRFQEELARWFSVYAVDLRGHGESEGCCAFGAREDLDVEAVVRLARSEGHRTVVTLGASMGGIAVIRHAALRGGVDAVVAVSTPARWYGHESAAVRKMVWFLSTRSGRALLRTCGIRVPRGWERMEDPVGLVGRISPTPVVIVHGRDDHFFDEEEAWMLYRRAREPKRLLLAGRFGHAEDGFAPAFAERISGVLAEVLPAPRSRATPERPEREAVTVPVGDGAA